MYFFFQAEDGIRDGHVTGVQTCALPIYGGEIKKWRLFLIYYKEKTKSYWCESRLTLFLHKQMRDVCLLYDKIHINLYPIHIYIYDFYPYSITHFQACSSLVAFSFQSAFCYGV